MVHLCTVFYALTLILSFPTSKRTKFISFEHYVIFHWLPKDTVDIYNFLYGVTTITTTTITITSNRPLCLIYCPQGKHLVTSFQRHFTDTWPDVSSLNSVLNITALCPWPSFPGLTQRFRYDSGMQDESCPIVSTHQFHPHPASQTPPPPSLKTLPSTSLLFSSVLTTSSPMLPPLCPHCIHY